MKICKNEFSGHRILTSRLKLKERCIDFRIRHEGIDTLHYEIITCTHCCFSMFRNFYSEPIPNRLANKIEKINIYKSSLNLTLKTEKEINEVFTGYYLALKCAELFYEDDEMMMCIAKIWPRLMWLYDDCGDEEMAMYAAKQAHAAYLDVYYKADVNPKSLQGICAMIGELSMRLNDLNTARQFFYEVRIFENGKRDLVIQAEDRMEEIRELRKK